MSRHEILDWVNAKVQFKVSKLEELCSGAEYCEMLEQIHPNCVGIRRVKFHAKLEHEYLHNFKLLQAAFTRAGIEKIVPVERLIKGRFQDNLEFIQWFKNFYETSSGIDNNKFLKKENNCLPIMKSKSNLVKESTRTALESKEATEYLIADPPSPSSVEVLEEQKQEIEIAINELKNDRNFYFSKLTKIENLLKDSIKRNENTEWCERAMNILYDGIK